MKKYFLFSLLPLLGLALMACTPATEKAPLSSLEGTWMWEQTQMNDGTIIMPNQVESFTLSFFTDESTGEPNRVSGTTDCNNFFGSYELGADNALSFGPLGSTMMYCEGSQEQDFMTMIGQVSHFMQQDADTLVLLLTYDSGSAIFKKTSTPQTPINEEPQEDDRGEEKADDDMTDIDENEVSYTGMSVSDAQALAETNGVAFRIVQQDGEDFMVTTDYVVGRINARVDNDIVIGYTVEGQE